MIVLGRRRIIQFPKLIPSRSNEYISNSQAIDALSNISKCVFANCLNHFIML